MGDLRIPKLKALTARESETLFLSGIVRTKATVLDKCQISSAVSTVLLVKRFAFAWGIEAEQCGYGDLR